MKPHAICVSFPAQGHLNPMMQLAKLLHSRAFHITFINSDFNHGRLIRAKGSSQWTHAFPDFRFDTMSEGLPPSDRDATQDPASLCSALQRTAVTALREVLERVGERKGSPPITCVVMDAMLSHAVHVVQEIGVPAVLFWTASACGFMGYLQFPELLRRGIVPFKDENYEADGSLDTAVEWVPGMKDIKLRDLPCLMRITNPEDALFNFCKNQVQACLTSPATIAFNTFDSMEQHILEALRPMFPRPIYTLGPISSLEKQCVPNGPLKSFRPSLWKDDTQCLHWLDQWDPTSVVYVNYGCITVMSQAALLEFAWGLANSKRPFLWVLRPDVVMGESGLLPQDFIDETRSRGVVVSWCPQEEVLSHPSVGVFVTHCGWNSMLEGVCEGGVPVICWPFFAEQQTNRRFACGEEWGVGVEMSKDVKREEVERLITQVLDTERGKRMRKRALGWKEMATEATSFGGSSFCNFDKFVKEALLSGVGCSATRSHRLQPVRERNGREESSQNNFF